MNIKYIDIYNDILNKLKDKLKYNITQEYSIRFENNIIQCSMLDENYYYITFSYIAYNQNDENKLKGFIVVKSKVPKDFDEYEFYQSHQNLFIDSLENELFKLKLEKELDKSENSFILKENKRRM